MRHGMAATVKADYFLKTNGSSTINVVNIGGICTGKLGAPAPVCSQPGV